MPSVMPVKNEEEWKAPQRNKTCLQQKNIHNIIQPHPILLSSAVYGEIVNTGHYEKTQKLPLVSTCI